MQTRKVGAGLAEARVFSAFHTRDSCLVGLAESAQTYVGISNRGSLFHLDRHTGSGLRSTCAGGGLMPADPLSGVESYTHSLSLVFLRKLKFSGKGYKIRKSLRGKGARMGFGHSHRLDLLLASCKILRLSKHKFTLLSNRLSDLGKDSKSLALVRKPSPYTKRGLRLASSLSIKRPGKKSTY